MSDSLITVHPQPEKGSPNGLVVRGLSREYWFPRIAEAHQIAIGDYKKEWRDAAEAALDWWKWNG